MSIIRNTASGLQKGRIGNTTYYVLNGQQVARQARNNSNYGEGASRSMAQQLRRIKWSNLVNFYKACRDWMPMAFENKKRNQSDYNKFMSVNINSSKVALTRDQALNGCAVVEPILVSQGSLTPIDQYFSQNRSIHLTNIELSVTTLASTPIAQLTQDIVTHNPSFQAGDNIALVLFSNGADERNYPYVRSTYYEFTLDPTSAELFSTLPISSLVSKDNNEGVLAMTVSAIPMYMGAVFIHTRRASNLLLTSTQSPVLYRTDFIDIFSSEEQVEKALASYGVSRKVPLDPTPYNVQNSTLSLSSEDAEE